MRALVEPSAYVEEPVVLDSEWFTIRDENGDTLAYIHDRGHGEIKIAALSLNIRIEPTWQHEDRDIGRWIEATFK